MFWIVLVAGWLVLAPFIAWAMGTAVVLADRANPPYQLDDATEDEECAAEGDGEACTQPGFQPELAAAG